MVFRRLDRTNSRIDREDGSSPVSGLRLFVYLLVTPFTQYVENLWVVNAACASSNQRFYFAARDGVLRFSRPLAESFLFRIVHNRIAPLPPDVASPEYLTLARTLHPGDLWWAENYTFLLSRGYQLRKRFKPGWVPSWELPGNHPWPSAYEDFQPAPARGNVLDAVRITDGVKVVLKIVRTKNEADLTIYFGNTLRESEPSAANRAVPVLEVISTPYETLIVLPFLREFLRLYHSFASAR
ncbi:hypothetical protein R3P38DRAFT_2774331 [Favolaschia claudopus]|uniref:Uncharacterized protein n=1 Tax=Favolaschia claudopus TaxID=2862362 RepID=A0AAW0BZ42_9AGAR